MADEHERFINGWNCSAEAGAPSTALMTAGRELDARIAEKVFGWKPENVDSVLVSRAWLTPEGHTRYIPKPYSTDIAAAWEAVEKLRANDFWFSMTYKCETFVVGAMDNGPKYFVRFRCVKGGTRGDYVESAKTAPLAICLAALKACKSASGTRARVSAQAESVESNRPASDT